MRTKRRVLAILFVGGVLWLYGAASATAQTQTFQGFTLKAASSGVTVTFNQPGSPVPANPTGEMHEAYSEARHETGPTGHSVSSVLWPGSTAANAGSFFGFPNYPVRSEAFYPQGPADHVSNDGGNFTMKTHSDDSKTEASTSTQAVPGGPVGTIGSLTSSAATTLESARVVSAGTAAANDINLLNGVIHFGSVVTEAKAITDGTVGTVEGQTTVTGATVAGVPVTVDSTGIHGPATVPFAPNPAQAALDQLGVSIRVAQPVDTITGADAARTAGGLVVTFSPATAGLPANFDTMYRFAGVSVSSAAVPPVSIGGAGGGGAAGGAKGKTAGKTTGGGTSGTPASGGTTSSGSGSTTTTIPGTPPTAGSTVPASEIVATQPVAAPLPIPAAAAIPATLGGVAVAAAAVGGRFLTGLARGAVTAEATGATCPLAEQ